MKQFEKTQKFWKDYQSYFKNGCKKQINGDGTEMINKMLDCIKQSIKELKTAKEQFDTSLNNFEKLQQQLEQTPTIQTKANLIKS